MSQPQHLRWWNLREAYRAVFSRENPTEKQTATLINDLREFCRADASCVVIGRDGHIDTHATAVCEGRREVYLRIVATLNLTDDQLLKMKELDHG